MPTECPYKNINNKWSKLFVLSYLTIFFPLCFLVFPECRGVRVWGQHPFHWRTTGRLLPLWTGSKFSPVCGCLWDCDWEVFCSWQQLDEPHLFILKSTEEGLRGSIILSVFINWNDSCRKKIRDAVRKACPSFSFSLYTFSSHPSSSLFPFMPAGRFWLLVMNLAIYLFLSSTVFLSLCPFTSAFIPSQAVFPL